MYITMSVLLLSLLVLPTVGGVGAAIAAAIQAPVLKWQHGGCYHSWCETGWYAAPAVADLDSDGTMEVIGAAYTLFVLNGADGTQQFSVDAAGSRVWPGVVVADIDSDGDLEIIIAQGGGYVTVLDHTGNIVWSRRPTSSELRGLSVYDLDGDERLEIIVTGAVGSQVNTWVYATDGDLRDGWPQLGDTSGYASGVYNSNAAVHDLDKDGQGEIVVPSDVHYICAYTAAGAQLPAHSIYGGKGWGKVGVWERLTTERRGWGTCSAGDARAERYRTNFAHGASVIADVNGDGSFEVIVTGNVYDCAVGHPPGKYNGVYLFKADRSRFNRNGYDWHSVPINTGAPLSEDYNVIENNQPNPVVVDLDGDGQKEILYASYDGRVHAFWLDKTEHGAWPFAVYKAQEGVYRFASEPVVADLNNDGRAEVLFASWAQKGSGKTGKLHVLDWQGQLLHEVALPPAFGAEDWNGALAAPTLANIDADPDLEVVLNTAHSGFVAYDLPGTANARILWGTGRGNYQRTRTAVPGPLPLVTITTTDSQATEPGTDRGRFRLTRTGSTAAPLAVRLIVSGSATNATDYQQLATTRNIPAGRASVSLGVVAHDDMDTEGSETVIVRIAASDAYRVGASAVAQVNILDND
jgi:hypothetical protein